MQEVAVREEVKLDAAGALPVPSLEGACPYWKCCIAGVVAVAVPVPVAVHRDSALVVVAAASTAQEVFHLEETLLASLRRCWLVGHAAAVPAPKARRRSLPAVAAMLSPVMFMSPAMARRAPGPFMIFAGGSQPCWLQRSC